MKSEILRLIDVFGTLSFAVAGVFAAMQKKLDLFGILIIAFITAVGGGTVRDILIGDLPVAWMRSLYYPLLILLAAVATVLFRNLIRNFQKTLLIFDSLGLGFFTILGVQKGLAFGFHPGICVALGTITGCFGGIIRDISLNNIPLVFQKEIYATACIIGGSVFFLLRSLALPADVVEFSAILVIFLVRLVAVRFRLGLPNLYKED